MNHKTLFLNLGSLVALTAAANTSVPRPYEDKYTLVARCEVLECKSVGHGQEICDVYDAFDFLRYTGQDNTKRFNGLLAGYLRQEAPDVQLPNIVYEPIEIYASADQNRMRIRPAYRTKAFEFNIVNQDQGVSKIDLGVFPVDKAPTLHYEARCITRN